MAVLNVVLQELRGLDNESFSWNGNKVFPSGYASGAIAKCRKKGK